MELVLNLICLALATSSILLWTVWRRGCKSRMVIELGRGWIVLGCILALIVPVISITDDLAQAPLLAEGANLQDVLKAPKYSIQSFSAATLIQAFFPLQQVGLWQEVPSSSGALCDSLCWGSNIEKRPPPYSSL